MTFVAALFAKPFHDYVMASLTVAAQTAKDQATPMMIANALFVLLLVGTGVIVTEFSTLAVARGQFSLKKSTALAFQMPPIFFLGAASLEDQAQSFWPPPPVPPVRSQRSLPRLSVMY